MYQNTNSICIMIIISDNEWGLSWKGEKRNNGEQEEVWSTHRWVWEVLHCSACTQVPEGIGNGWKNVVLYWEGRPRRLWETGPPLLLFYLQWVTAALVERHRTQVDLTWSSSSAKQRGRETSALSPISILVAWDPGALFSYEWKKKQVCTHCKLCRVEMNRKIDG